MLRCGITGGCVAGGIWNAEKDGDTHKPLELISL